MNTLQSKVPFGLSQGSVDTYASDLKMTLLWARNSMPKALGSADDSLWITQDRIVEIIRREQLEKLFRAMHEDEVDESTLKRREVVLRKLFEWCTTERAGYLLEEHPFSKSSERLVKTGVASGSQRDIDEFVNYEMVGRLLLNLHNECERVFFHFLFDVAPRVAEAMEITADQLPKLNPAQRAAKTLEDYYLLDHRDLYLPLKLYARKKRGATPPARQVMISLPTVKRIYQYHQTMEYRKAIMKLGFTPSSSNRPVFLTSTGQRWQKRNTNKQFRAAVERAYLPKWFVGHGLRGGGAYLILVSEDMGRTFSDRFKTAKAQLGHRWMSTLEKYYTTLPAPLLLRFQNKAKDNLKWKYLFDLREETYLGPKKHKENRGKSRRG